MSAWREAQPSRIRVELLDEPGSDRRPAARQARSHPPVPSARSTVSTANSRPATAASRNSAVQGAAESIDSSTDDLADRRRGLAIAVARALLGSRPRTRGGGRTPARTAGCRRSSRGSRPRDQAIGAAGGQLDETSDIWFGKSLQRDPGCAGCSQDLGQRRRQRVVRRQLDIPVRPEDRRSRARRAGATNCNSSSDGCVGGVQVFEDDDQRAILRGRLQQVSHRHEQIEPGDSGEPELPSGGSFSLFRSSGRIWTMFGSGSSGGPPASWSALSNSDRSESAHGQ